MPISCSDHNLHEEHIVCVEDWEAAIMVLALDHFFAEVVEGNLPLNQAESWWNREPVPERVNRYSENWAVLFEGLARVRERLEQCTHHGWVEADANLNFTYTRRGKPNPVKWEAPPR